MNQQVQILDGFEYVEQLRALKLIALAAGQLISCYVDEVAEHNAQSFYQKHQFDIEELLIEQIELERWTESGEVRILSSAI
ncbi:hypothetical protein [Aliiglaciecola litoralis]